VKLLAIVLVLVAGCRKDAPEASAARWPEVERLATPLVPGGDGALLEQALARVTMEDVPEAALEDVIAWRKAGGGLPWRAGRAIEDRRALFAFKLGKALVERRAADPEAIHTALYLAHRLRAEAPAMLDVVIGFELAKVVIEAKLPTRPELAPTEAEVRRAVAADAVFSLRAVEADPSIDAKTKEQVKADFVALVVGAPAGRAPFAKHLAAMQAKLEKSAVMSLLVPRDLAKRVDEMFATIDAYPR
jgi:hypothetical protein